MSSHDDRLDDLMRSAFDELDRAGDTIRMRDGVAGVMDRRRRTRRRVSVGTTLVVAALAVPLGVGIASMYGESDPLPVAADSSAGFQGQPPVQEESRLTLTPANGPASSLDQFAVACSTVPGIDGGSLEIIRLISTHSSSSNSASSFIFQAEVSKLSDGEVLRLPLSAGETAETPADFLAFASTPGAGGAEDADSSSPGTEGTVRILEAACGASPAIIMEIDARLGAEDGTGFVAVEGAVQSRE